MSLAAQTGKISLNREVTRTFRVLLRKEQRRAAHDQGHLLQAITLTFAAVTFSISRNDSLEL